MGVREAANETVLVIEYVTSTVHLHPWDAIMITRMALDNTSIGLEILITEASCSMIASWVEDTPSIYVQFTHANQRLVMNHKRDHLNYLNFWTLQVALDCMSTKTGRKLSTKYAFLATFVWPLECCTLNLTTPKKRWVLSSKVQMAASKWLGDRKFR